MTYTLFPLYYSQTENNMSKSNPPSQRADSAEYLQRKSFFDQLITVYGRKPVVEILQDPSLKIYHIDCPRWRNQSTESGNDCSQCYRQSCLLFIAA